MKPNKEQSTLAPHTALLAVQFSFGSLPVIGKVVLAVLPAVSLVGFRVGITAMVLAALQAYRRRFWLRDRADYKTLAILSIFGVVLNQLLFIGGLSLTKASNTSLLAVTIPVFALAVGYFAGTEFLTRSKVLGIVIAAAGVLFLIDPRNASFSSDTTIGDIMIILNSLSYGAYVAVSKEALTRNGAFRSIMWIFIFASIICVPLGLLSVSTIDIAAVPPVIWAGVLYISLVATALPYILNAWAIARVPPSTVAVFIYLQPLIGFMMAVAFLNEHADLKFGVAMFLIFAGVYLTTRRHAPT